MKRIHIIGRKNHGKTQLVVDLVEELTRRGLRVGAIKHTHHDTPGKDSHRHRGAGAAMVGILSRNMSAVFIPSGHVSKGHDQYAVLAGVFADCDLVVVEGDSQTSAPKIEVWRGDLGTKPLAEHDDTILAIVTDDPLDISTLTHQRANVPELADWILKNLPGQADL